MRGIATPEAANVFLREHYIAEFNRRFQVRAAERGIAFVPRRSKDLDLIFSLQFERRANRDNTVSFQKLTLQIEPVGWRATLAGCIVVVHQHLDGTLSITFGPHRLGRYTAHGKAFTQTNSAAPKSYGKGARWKSPKADFSTSLGNPAKNAGFPLSTQLRRLMLFNKQNRTFHVLRKPDILTCYEQ